ncbi:MAG: inositol monophosphatase [Opitutaceae bacterium]|nr:inositol monophosphatase [Verrucomicrobiales bacterium]
MTYQELRRALKSSVAAARAAGALMSKNLGSTKKVNEETQHDIKLELDVRCQKLIEKRLHHDFPAVAVLGEEGVAGDPQAAARWVVDPIDGTVNFTYGIPHACVSIALQLRGTKRGQGGKGSKNNPGDTSYTTVVGVVYDPFLDEMWTAIKGEPARLNGRVIHVSKRRKLDEAIIAMGFAKYEVTLQKMLPVFNRLVPRVRKIRLLGAAALSMTWVAAGRLDAYKEYGVRLWDIAAGGLIIECAGGEFWHRPIEGEHAYEICVNNGLLRKQIEAAS